MVQARWANSSKGSQSKVLRLFPRHPVTISYYFSFTRHRTESKTPCMVTQVMWSCPLRAVSAIFHLRIESFWFNLWLKLNWYWSSSGLRQQLSEVPNWTVGKPVYIPRLMLFDFCSIETSTWEQISTSENAKSYFESLLCVNEISKAVVKNFDECTEYLLPK